ncbi:nitroreductase family deazaflavin-dependent oxidoreductase [Herbidospora mongoliensis]|uniref:nitroreductase family deazaflavin-dependent oxidoreductase n=1 Tax=Herbidospora mongoliensis TaxID=688067 RepID=UPI00082BA354|nr:nitroreductase family deazaflavin-dependent oxidoreductase [Herbidospora mongoliensis]
MTFDTPAGTRGSRQPAGRLLVWFNSLMARRIRKRGAFGGFNALVLTTVGRKTGQPRTTPVGWFPGPDGTWLIVASAAGAPGNPAWYYNLGAHPDQVRIELDGKTFDVTADQLHGTEREQAWREIVAKAPRFAEYQEKTDRELPVIRLKSRP